MENQSRYDPSRKTVGAIYQDAQKASHEPFVTNGDLTKELMSSLVEDLNDTINSKPYGDKSYYITVHEKKDLQMPRSLLRRMLTTLYRPWPEDDTLVFYIDQQKSIVKYCWCLPHHTEMENMLRNESLFDQTMISEIKYWRNYDLHPFGFKKDEIGNWIPNPTWEDKLMKESDGIKIFKFDFS